MAGFDPFIYEDFADAMFDLLRDVASAMQAGHAEQTLLAAFNDESNQASILTYLKTLTAAWMKTRPQDYAPWLLEQTVEEYCNASVMPTSAEIENVGLSALKDTFLSPAGITLEVLYLDRSEGSEVNMHRFSPVNHGGFDVGTVRLLYRPYVHIKVSRMSDKLTVSQGPLRSAVQTPRPPPRRGFRVDVSSDRQPNPSRAHLRHWHARLLDRIRRHVVCEPPPSLGILPRWLWRV